MSLIPKKGTVYVVDDDEAVRDSLQWLLEGKDYRVKCFDSAEAFLSRFDPREVACLVADIRMDGMSGLELQDRLLERKSPLPIVFITGHGDIPMTVRAIKAGAVEFLPKPFRDQDLLDAIAQSLAQARAAQQARAATQAVRARFETLTPREREVLALMVQGLRNKQSTDRLGISEVTVKVHRHHVMEKMGARSLPMLVDLVDRLGLRAAPQTDAA